MERGIITVEDTEEHRQLLEEAGDCALGTDAELVLVALITKEAYETGVENLASIGQVEDVSYDNETVLKGARNEVEMIAAEVLDGTDVRTESVAVVADEADHAERLIALGEEHDCDHAFIIGRKRSPTGKAVFGDQAQQVLLNFDGYVTVNMT